MSENNKDVELAPTADILKALARYSKGLRKLGETTGANMLDNRIKELEAPVVIHRVGDKIHVTTPFIGNRKKFMALVMSLKAVESREWDSNAKTNVFAKKDEKAVREVLESFYAGNKIVVTTEAKKAS